MGRVGRLGSVLLAVAMAVMMVGMVSSANGPDGDAPRPDEEPAGGSAGGAGEVTADADTVRRAVEATAAIDRARVELQTVYAGLAQLRGVPAGVGEIRTVQRAAFDRQAGRVRAESDMSELAAVLETADESVPGDYSLPTRLVIDGDTVYAQIGPMARAVGLEPTSWIRRGLAGFADESADNETAALLLDPLGMLGLLARPVVAVRALGPDQVRDVPTTHMTATVDLTAAPPAPQPSSTNGSSASPNGDGSASGGELEARFRAIGIDELPIDVWVGGDDIIRRLEFRLDAATAGRGDGSGPGGLTTTFDVYDVDEPIDIPVPDPADVVDPSDLRPRLDP
jgi:hypothetical protein